MDMIRILTLLIPFVLIVIGDSIRYLITRIYLPVIRRQLPVLIQLLTRTSDRLLQLPGAVNAEIKRIRFPKQIFKYPKLRLPTVARRRYPALPRSQVIYPSPLQLARQIRAFFAGVTMTLLFIMLPYSLYSFVRDLPNPRLLKERTIDVSTKIFDRNGVLLYEIYADENRTPIPLSDIPQYLRDATIAIEDKDFYKHNGFSVRAILRAFRETVINKNVQGGSTITQQLVKSALLTPEVTVERKIKEILLSFWAERIYTKDQILEMYLNQVPYGGTAWGIESASRTYFDKPVRDVTLPEAALLAGLPQAPSEYSPFTGNADRAKNRQRQVLNAMVLEGFVGGDEADKAVSAPISYASRNIDIEAPHFVMYVREYLEKTYGTRMVEKGGLRIRTTLDLNLQKFAQQVVTDTVAELSGLRVGNGAALITNPVTGEILSMVGSVNYFDESKDGNVNVATRLRQPGSAIKAVTYALALDNGFSPVTYIDDSPVAYRTPGSPVYAPVNYDGRFHGQVTLRDALANSYNIPAVRVLNSIGVKPMIDTARKMGIDTWTNEGRYGLSITLGGADVTMTDLSEVYGTLARGGTRINLTPILEVLDYTGRKIFSYEVPDGVRAVSPAAAYIISDILSDNNARSAAFGSRSLLEIPGFTVAVKTGTSNDKRDNWTVGYTPDRLVAVWVGNNDNTPMDPVLTSGVTGASPIWNVIMKRLTEGGQNKPFPKPDSVTGIPCYNGRQEYFIAGTEPKSGTCPPGKPAVPTSTPAR